MIFINICLLMKFIEYNLDDSCRKNHMVKITYSSTYNESFWVWIERIINDNIIGIICNDLMTTDLHIGQKIKFNKKHIKEYSNRNYTLEETLDAINLSNNRLIKVFSEANKIYSSE